MSLTVKHLPSLSRMTVLIIPATVYWVSYAFFISLASVLREWSLSGDSAASGAAASVRQA